jgi:hypothetical protein
MSADTTPAMHFEVGGRLPALSAPDGRHIWRPQYTRSNMVLAVLHGSGCEICAAYAGVLAAERPSFHAWDGRLVLALPAGDPGAGPRGAGAAAAPPPAATVPDTFGGAPRIIIADRFGQIYHLEDAGPAHALPEPRALEEWLRFIATQCPE